MVGSAPGPARSPVEAGHWWKAGVDVSGGVGGIALQEAVTELLSYHILAVG